MATPPPPQGPYPPTPPQGTPYGPPQGAYGAYGPSQGAPPYAPQYPATPYAQPHAPSHAAHACQICGALPAVQATVRGHQGMIVLMRFLSRRGMFCRSCGLATYREMSAKTLWQGWWGPLSVVITPITLLANLGPRARFRTLPAPTGGFRPALDPGKPLLRRPEALICLVPAALVALALVAIPVLAVIGIIVGPSKDDTPTGIEKRPTLEIGNCVRNEGDWQDQDLRVVDCGSADAEYQVTRRLEKPKSTCADGEFYADLSYGPGGTTTSCLKPRR
ncbi:hypothetical protein [Streptomyces sp. NPDC048650]|uniref:LppU/SCO3897 family protein n=1 Tax=unclassified Streptomyces TaxID=2593676 RepID=UPI003720F496